MSITLTPSSRASGQNGKEALRHPRDPRAPDEQDLSRVEPLASQPDPPESLTLRCKGHQAFILSEVHLLDAHAVTGQDHRVLIHGGKGVDAVKGGHRGADRVNKVSRMVLRHRAEQHLAVGVTPPFRVLSEP